MIQESKSPTLAKKGFIKVLDEDKKDIYIDIGRVEYEGIRLRDLFAEYTQQISQLQLSFAEYQKRTDGQIITITDNLSEAIDLIISLQNKLNELTQFSFGD